MLPQRFISKAIRSMNRRRAARLGMQRQVVDRMR
jgi:hypothetical protein